MVPPFETFLPIENHHPPVFFPFPLSHRAFNQCTFDARVRQPSIMAQSSLIACTHLDESFGPHAGDCRGGFDFTLLFEETILTLVPVGILLLVLPPRVWYLSRRAKKVAAGKRSAAIKIVSLNPNAACVTCTTPEKQFH